MSENHKSRVIVCQHGARRRYAIPRMLEEAGMLEALYIDSCEHSFLGKVAKAIGPLSTCLLKRLANRKVVGIPKEKILSTDVPTYKFYMTKKGLSKIDDYLLIHESMNEQLIKFGTHDADTLYCFEGENLGYIQYAKEKGLSIILDVCFNPFGHRIVRNELIRYDKYIQKLDGLDKYISFREKYFQSQAEFADILLCPSEFVAEGVKELCPEYADKIRICPYGSSIDYNGRLNKPVKGRFFWAGGDWIRKGLHYLAEAADKLKKQYPEIEFRAAGITDLKVIRIEQFKNITFLGKLNKQQMQDEFLNADAFAFPTLSEGMSGVVLEAIAAGCPVITTKAVGIDAFENGKNGILIPSKNSKALASAIETLYCNRKLRNTISEQAYKLRFFYREDSWRERLINVLENKILC